MPEGLNRYSIMPQIRCVVERITYQNPENGYSVFRVKVKGYDDLVTLAVLMNYLIWRPNGPMVGRSR